MTRASRLMRLTRLSLLLAGLLPVLPSAPAQTSRPGNSPGIAYVYPAGGCRGATFTVSVGGQRLANASGAHLTLAGASAEVIDHHQFMNQKELDFVEENIRVLQDARTAAKALPPGWTPDNEKVLSSLRASRENRPNRQVPNTLAETVTLRITLPADAPAGVCELRLRTTAGLSNPLLFQIGALPEFVEPAASRPRTDVPRNDTVNTLGVALPVAINGRIMPAETDRYRFSARRGQRLTFAVSARSLIPYLADAVPGWFQATLALYDSAGRELAYVDDFRHDPDPVLFHEIEVDGDYIIEIKDALHRGREDFVYRLVAGELPYVTGIFPPGGRAGEATPVRIRGMNIPAPPAFLVDPGPPGTARLPMPPDGPFATLVDFVRGDGVEAGEREPNDTPASAQAVVVPLTLNGAISTTADHDVFRLHAGKGDKIVAEVTARRIGSPLDSTLTVSDASGRVIAANDDHDDRASGLITHQADSLVQFTAPADGEYFIGLRDTSSRGGADYVYRLHIGPPQPDFTVLFTPSSINLRPGGTATVQAHAVRRDGFDGEITLAIGGTTGGFKLKNARIPAGKTEADFTVSAPAAAADGVYVLTLSSAARIGERDTIHPALPAEDRMQAFLPRHLVESQTALVSVNAGWRKPPRIVLDGPLKIPLGGRATFSVNLPEIQGATRARLEPIDPPPGIALAAVPAGANGEIPVVVSCDAAKLKPGMRGLLVLGAFVEDESAPGVPGRPLGTLPPVTFEVTAPE